MAITNTSSFSFRLAGDLKQEAFTILENYGFTPSQALNLFLTEIVNTKTVPLNLSYLQPNATTLNAMQEAESGKLEIITSANSNENIVEVLQKVKGDQFGQSSAPDTSSRYNKRVYERHQKISTKSTLFTRIF